MFDGLPVIIPWEPFSGVKSLEALDHYYTLMGIKRWQALRRKLYCFLLTATPGTDKAPKLGMGAR